MAPKRSPADEAGTVERIHRSTQKLMDDIDSLNAEYFAEAKKKLPAQSRMAALSQAIEVAQSSLVRQNFVAQRWKDGLHPKAAPLMSNDTHQTTAVTTPTALIFTQRGSFDAVRELIDEAKKSGTGFTTPGHVKSGRNRVNP